MANEEAVLDSAKTEPKKRPRGRPRKEAPQHATILSDVPNPPRLKYYSDSASPNQRTASGLKWWNELSDPCKELIDVTIYRDWPTLNDPTEEGEYKYIDKLLGTQPLKNDQDFIDRWGAGDYHAYVNVTPLGGTRRTIMMLFVKGSHDFKTYLPTDQRIDNPGEHLSLSDPGNASYVAWLRSTGKIKNDAQITKETEDMAAGNAVMAEIVKDALADRREMTQKLLEKSEQEREVLPPDPPPSPQEVISEQLSIFKSLKELVPTSDPLEMVKQVIGMAQVLTQKDSNADLKPLQDEISKLREESRATEREMWRTQFAELKEQIRLAKETPPAPNVLLPDGSNLQAVIEKAVAKAVDNGLEDTAWWVEPLKQLIPVATPVLMIGLQRLMAPAPPPVPFPMPPPNFQAGQPQSASPAQLPAPQSQAQPAAPQPNAEEVEINRILTAISSPVIDALASGDDGDQFADYVREEYGASSQRLLAKFSEQEIAGALMMFPLTAPRMTQFPQARVAAFVKSFKEYDRDAYDLKMEAAEKH